MYRPAFPSNSGYPSTRITPSPRPSARIISFSPSATGAPRRPGRPQLDVVARVVIVPAALPLIDRLVQGAGVDEVAARVAALAQVQGLQLPRQASPHPRKEG